MESVIIAFVITLILMIITWVASVKINHFAIIDAIWSFSFSIHGAVFYFFNDGSEQRKAIMLLMITFWSCRLGYYLSKRLYNAHPVEDNRYLKLKSEYGEKFKQKFLRFFIYQALSVSLLTVPFVFAFKNQNATLNPFEYFGFFLWLLAIMGETLADYQLNSFKGNSANKGKVCDVGLWKYSRHPNYFFESLIWWGFFIFILGSGYQLIWAIYAPVIILLLLLKVTGVPPSEEQSLKSRGDLYREYQKKTSVFVPWFQKK